jgi:hypothetical protein
VLSRRRVKAAGGLCLCLVPRAVGHVEGSGLLACAEGLETASGSHVDPQVILRRQQLRERQRQGKG